MTIAFPKPDEAILSRRAEIIAGLARLVAGEALIVSEDERRAFETDGLTAYRQMPLAVVLPSSTAEVSAILRFCHENGVKVVPRGAGTSLCGGAIPQADAIVLGVAKMNRVLEVDLADRFIRVEVGHHQSGHQPGGRPRGLFLRAGSVEPARLHDRRQYRDEFRRRPLPEIRRDHQQPARRHAWC